MAMFYSMRTKIVSGIGCIKEIGNEVKALKRDHVLIVTDKGITEAGILDIVKKNIEDAGLACDVFNEVERDPSIETIGKLVEVVKQSKANLLVAIGGGSSLDCAKGAAASSQNKGTLRELWHFSEFENEPLPVIAVTTTAGTGSEVTIYSVVTDLKTHEKFSLASTSICPKTAILDPELTLKLPPKITAYTGMDALTHALEAYTSVFAQPATDCAAHYAMGLIAKNLPIAVWRGDNIEARQNMLQAALLAGFAFSNAFLGLAHAVAHPLGGHFHMPHGTACSVILPYVMQFNLPATITKYAEIGRIFDVPETNERKLAEGAIDAVIQLMKDIQMPLHLKDAGATEDKLEIVAHDSMASRQVVCNPRIANEQEVLGIIKTAF